ncbi:hypothetical protein SDC9_178204 [bioreactor metagenome]|uniref:MalT-like TPR region domain-containing protein n=1 Tax=bioreactor metagenome TaxID=1076179 RepID=A0A645H4H1_9ZZZZ
MRTKIYIRQEQYDKALDVCKKGMSVYNGIINSSDKTVALALQTQQAVAYALKGNMDSAVKVIDEAYKAATNAQALTIEQVNIYALFNKLAGNDKPYNEAKELLEGSGYSLSEKVTQCINKKITLVDIFVKGEIEWYSK